MDEKNLKPGQIFQERYEIISLIAKGGMGTTYLATDKKNGVKVVLKVLAFSEIGDWKVLELFEREIDVLKSLNHPYIPNYIDNFRYEKGSELLFILVQKYVPGKNLEEMIQSGKRFSEKEIKNILRDLLNALDYIHNIQPAIIHRDINPRNIVLGNDGKTYLVDFNASGRIAKSTQAAGGTYVGTFGYMAQEQLYGKAYPATDIYGLGITIIFLLSRMHPDKFPINNMKLDFRSYVNIQPQLEDLLDAMIEPDVNKRIASAKDALDFLEGKKAAQTGKNRSMTLKELKDAGLIKAPDNKKKQNVGKVGSIVVFFVVFIFGLTLFFALSKTKPNKTLAVRRYTNYLPSAGLTVRITGPQNVDFDRIVDYKDAAIKSIAISPDSRYIAGAGTADVILIWDIETGKQLKRLVGHRREINSILFSPDSKRIISLGEDKKVITWDWIAGKIIKIVHLDNFIISKAEISPDGKTLLINDYSKKLHVVNLENGKVLKEIPFGAGYSRILRTSPDGNFAASHSTNKVFIVNIANSEIWSVETRTFLYDFKFSPDSKFLFFENKLGIIAAYSLAKKSFSTKGKTIEYPAYCIEVSSDNKMLAVSQFSDLHLIDFSGDKPISVLRSIPGSYYSFKEMKFSSNGKYIFIEYKNHTILRLNIELKKIDKVFIPVRNSGRAPAGN